MDAIKFNKYLFTLSHLHFKDMLAVSLSRLGSVNHYYILRRSLLSLPLDANTRASVSISEITSSDLTEIVRLIEQMDGDSKKELIARLIFYKAGFKNCYIAKTKKGEIAFIQWLVFPADNRLIQKYCPRTFYPLSEGQVMVENAFTFPKFRGLGLLPRVTGELLGIARQAGHTNAITYIRKDRIASLNEFLVMGFKITKLVKEYKFIGITARTL